MSPHILFFTGAPLSTSLDWHPDHLLNAFSPTIIRFAQLDDEEPGPQPQPPSQAYASWRSLRLADQRLSTGVSQNHAWWDEYKGNAAFFDEEADGTSYWQSGRSQSGCQPPQDVASQFYEHSFALHEDLTSSQIPVSAPNDAASGQLSVGDESTGYASTSFATSVSDLSTNSPAAATAVGREPVQVANQISSLDAIPHAAYLQSIHPQTMSVNLVVGIISVSPPRAIRTRHSSLVEIIEMLVGDETRAGFGINFWVPSSGTDSLKSALAGLRPRDIILLRNVALSSFRGNVYGQSLRRGLTKVHLLYRKRIDRTDVGGCYTTEDLGNIPETDRSHECLQRAKTKRVKDWVIQFVGLALGGIRRTKKGNVEVVGEAMPPDTQ